MIAELLKDQQFQELEKEYKFLSRARGELLENLEYVILDIETTGLEPTLNEITEIGALKIENKEVKNIFSSLIKPKTPVSLEITRLTGIDNEMVKDSPAVELVLPKFLDFIGSAILVVHNAEFDISFLKHHLKKALNKEIQNQIACTLKISRYLLPNLVNHKLHTVAAHFELSAENRHRAIGDVELTYQVWLNFINLLKEKGLTHKCHLDSLMSQL